LSSYDTPKQFLKFPGEKYSILQNLLRALINLGMRPLISTNINFLDIVQRQLDSIKCDPIQILLEEEPCNTGIAIAFAALYAVREMHEDSILLILPSDFKFLNFQSFLRAAYARIHLINQYIVLFGAKPTYPNIQYGYLQTGDKIMHSTFQVSQFIEKPNIKDAKKFIEMGCLWNCGIIMSSAALLASVIKKNMKIEYSIIDDYLHSNKRDKYKVLPSNITSSMKKTSIEKALMEKNLDALAVINIDFKWRDFGNLKAIWAYSDKDTNQNVIHGSVATLNVTNSYIASDGRKTFVAGIDGIMVLNKNNTTLIASRKHCADANSLYLKDDLEVIKPWGYYLDLYIGDKFKIKQLVIFPGKRTSLQLHKKRSEYWLIISGVANIVVGTDSFNLSSGQSIMIKRGQCHRVANPLRIEKLIIIEIQIGINEEEDIVRIQDDYGRCNNKMSSNISNS
ncbi:MAG: sugar phosphate nucleotidyltransferase, partial [Proteobacteria bacterium]|nr:sugar phosphate nucleotidyltransferase [Pseudomonadota bacterium]